MTTCHVIGTDRELVPAMVQRMLVDDDKHKSDCAGMVWELYRDKVLTVYQTKEILLCLGFTVYWNVDGTALLHWSK